MVERRLLKEDFSWQPLLVCKWGAALLRRGFARPRKTCAKGPGLRQFRMKLIRPTWSAVIQSTIVFQSRDPSWLLSVMNKLWIVMKTLGVSTNSYRISAPIFCVIILSYFGHKWPSWLLSFVSSHGLGEFIELYAYLWLWSWCTMQGCYEVGIMLRFAKREQIDTPHECTWKLQWFGPEFESVGIPDHNFSMSHAEEVTSCVRRSLPVVCHLMGIDLHPMVLGCIYIMNGRPWFE